MVIRAIETWISVISRTVVARSNSIHWSSRNDSFLLIPIMKKVKPSKYYKKRASIGLWKVVYYVFDNGWSTGHQVPPRYKFLTI